MDKNKNLRTYVNHFKEWQHTHKKRKWTDLDAPPKWTNITNVANELSYEFGLPIKDVKGMLLQFLEHIKDGVFFRGYLHTKFKKSGSKIKMCIYLHDCYRYRKDENESHNT